VWLYRMRDFEEKLDPWLRLSTPNYVPWLTGAPRLAVISEFCTAEQNN